MPTLREVEQFERDLRSIDERRLRFAEEKGERHARGIAKRHVTGQIEATLSAESEMLPTVLALTPHERRRYSLTQLIRDLANRQHGVNDSAMSLEREISAAIAKDLGRVPEHGGVFVPLRLSASGLDSRSQGSGGYLTSPKVGPEIVDALRQHAMVLKLGARLLTGLGASQQFPVEDANSLLTAQWTTENSDVDLSESDPAFTAKVISPHSLGASTVVSRALLTQSSSALEAWLRDRLAKAHALALDAAGINGSGESGQPVGILKTAGIGDTAMGASGGAPTADAIRSLEGYVAKTNADSDACAFLTSPAMRTKLRALPEITGGSTALWRDGRMLDYVAAASNQVPQNLTKSANNDCHAVVFGDWGSLLVGEFSGSVEIVVDVYAQKRRGLLEVASWGCYDIMLSQAGAFAAIQDARAV